MKREPVTLGREADNWLHRLLRQRSAKPGAAAPAGNCLDADVLAAWADGTLSAKELAIAETHVANCPRCLTILAAIERTVPPASVQPQKQHLLIRWLVPLTVAATAVAIWVAIPEQQVIPVARETAATRETPSTSSPIPAPSPAPPPVAAPRLDAKQVEGRQEKAQSQRAANARADEEAATDRLARLESALADSAAPVSEPLLERDRAAVGNSAATPAAPPAPQASAGALSETIGATAQRRAFSKESVFEAVSPTEPLVRWRVLSGTEIERSTDGGKSWARTSKPPAPISGIRVVDALSATVTTSDGRSFSTADGGATWTPVQEKPAAPF
ncbi:MAG TPA: zf-HC2 domain-containing protein [Vicinamibacterales bacterium]|nr:zf-HC2 domain-containing protein [Vicinamibacterales bacterium]